MQLNWLLFTHSGRSSRNRLALTTAAIALGVLMILILAAGINALSARSENSNWRLNFYNNQTTTKPISGVSPLKATLQSSDSNLNKYKDKIINVASMYATGDTSPELPDMPTPNPGEYYVSPGLEKVIKQHPGDNIGKRFGDRQIGVMPNKYVGSPDSLYVVRGMSAGEANSPNVTSVYKLNTSNGVSPYSGMAAILLIIGATILFVPVIIFLMIATQFGSVQREQRYSALRLVGATRRQVTQIIMFESSMAALAGISAGTVLYLLVRAPLTSFRFDDMRFWPNDIAVPTVHYIEIVAIVILLSVLANWWGMRRVQLSPLGVARKQFSTKRPRFVRLIPLLAGVTLFVWTATVGKSWVLENVSGGVSLYVLLAGILSVMFGLIIAGPYLTRLISGMIAARTRSASTLLATKRIETQFKPVFRSVSGIVLALFAGSFYLTAVSGIADYSQKSISYNGYSQLKPDTVIITGTGLSDGMIKQLQTQPYVDEAAGIYSIAGRITVMPCNVAATYTTVNCPSNTAFVGLNLYDTTSSKKWYGKTPTNIGDQIIRDIHADPASTRQLLPNYLVKLDSNNNLDQLRSFVAIHTQDALSSGQAVYVVSGTYAQKAVLSPMIKEFSGLAYVGMGVTLLIAIASLMVSTIGGLYERRRSFATLRLSGMNVRQMKRTVLVESLIPLLATSLLSAGIGCWIGYVFMEVSSRSLQVILQPSYFSIVGGSLILAAIAIYSVLPMLDKLTRPEANQTE